MGDEELEDRGAEGEPAKAPPGFVDPARIADAHRE
jgi:hypothetical protein